MMASVSRKRLRRVSINTPPKRRRTADERSETDQDKGAQPLGYMALKEICDSNSPEDGVLELANKSKRFEALLNSAEIRPDLMILIIRVLYLCAISDQVRQHVEKVLRIVVKTKFLRLHLSSFVRQIPFHSKTKEGFQPNDVIMHLAESFLELLQRFGHDIVDATPLAELSEALEELKRDQQQQQTTTTTTKYDTNMIEQKVTRVKELRNEIIRRKIESLRKQEDESEVEPPQSFREVSVIPQTADLNIHDKPFLRANIVGGRYKNLEHYLDVQFRLLREDFILPLRQGIKQLRKDSGNLETSSVSDSKHANDVNVYHHVRVLYPVYSGKGMVYKIRFDWCHHSVRHVRWEKSKRLKFGSLLCLSADDFYNLLFATVENRDPRDLCRGELEIRFEGIELKRLNQCIQEEEAFDMVESPAFFEAYRPVLEGLQKIQLDDLPFQEHIIECNPNVGPPGYEIRTRGLFDMSGITKNEVGEKNIGLDNKIEDVDDNVLASDTRNMSLDDSSETSMDNVSLDHGPEVVNIYHLQLNQESLGLNESQMRAFKMALTKKIAVIQGPPGTGKTYVGQKIARVLLQSVSLWQDDETPSPILMVSYTNHALDEFLRGIPKEGIVRVGGRCSEEMKRHSLKYRRDEARMSKTVPRRILIARISARDELRRLQECKAFQDSAAVVKCSRRGILSFQVLKPFMDDSHVRWFEDKATESINGLFLDWLAVKVIGGEESVREVERDVTCNEDLRMQISFRTFINDEDFEDENKQAASKPCEVVICRAEDTNTPTELCKVLQASEVMTEYEEKCTHDLWKMSSHRRWKLYRLWLQRAEKHYLNNLQNLQLDYERILARQNEVMQEEDFYVLQNARVIGMTTTCAARYRQILQRICPKIVLVEEAAEVLEAHIITSLSKECQHLILIGDHLQLRPSPAVYELAKRYKLDVSLFERMITIGIPCERLSVQHRMRPEIAALMKYIYEDLKNHESVGKYEDIKGMKKNMFFVNHSHLEDCNYESHSHTNDHEASFLVALCHYVLQQGYSARQVTLLTTCTGQMFAIRDCLKQQRNDELKSVRLTTVDNFQGEENDIILLSLVRSNNNGKVGFIKIVNRACVALSRAKKGFYCIGNFDLLVKHSEIWSKIVSDLKASLSIGNALPLVCQIHHKEETAETAKDFLEKVPNGGCSQSCEVRLSCGHACKLSCHPKDPGHAEYLCTEKCTKSINGCSHPCPKLCWQKCETKCLVFVKKTLPSCHHSKMVRCSQDVYRVKCELQCEKTLPKCGHRCQTRCGERCTAKCNELVKRSDWPCRHDVTTACSSTPADCPMPCGATLGCGHKCKGACGECRMGRVHKRCNLKCGRFLVCSHACKASCNSCPPCSMNCENRCVHSRCPKRCGELCVPCAQKCPWECRHYKCTELCGQLCNRPRCNEPCKKIMKCGKRDNTHRCRGLCGETCICALCDKNDGTYSITESFFGGEDEEDALFIQLPDCKHIFAVSDLDRYMDMSDDYPASQVIQLKPCPRCKTPIRRSLRYGNVIKQQLQNIEEVKKKVRGDSVQLEEAKDRVQKHLTVLMKRFDGEKELEEWRRLERRVSRMSKGIVEAVTTNQVTLMERYCCMSRKLNQSLLNDVARREASFESRLEGSSLQEELDHFKKRLMSEAVTEKELRDINLEFTRLNLQLELCLLKHDVLRLKLTVDEPSSHTMQEVREDLSSGIFILLLVH